MTIQWRQMTVPDLDEVMVLAEQAHPGLPERRETQLKRLRLFPQGCQVLGDAESVLGYAFAHPILPDTPPALDVAPTSLDPAATHLYLHDFVVSPLLHGQGHARAGVGGLLALSEAFDAVPLISVYDTSAFWARFGFRPWPLSMPQKLASYGPEAVFMSRRHPPA